MTDILKSIHDVSKYSLACSYALPGIYWLKSHGSKARTTSVVRDGLESPGMGKMHRMG